MSARLSFSLDNICYIESKYNFILIIVSLRWTNLVVTINFIIILEIDIWCIIGGGWVTWVFQGENIAGKIIDPLLDKSRNRHIHQFHVHQILVEIN